MLNYKSQAQLVCFIAFFLICFCSANAQTNIQSTSHTEANLEQGTLLQLTPAQVALANIQVKPAAAAPRTLERTVQGTLHPDPSQTTLLAPQLESKILRVFIQPGQSVRQGQALIQLGGTHIAQAQAEYVIAATEWQRIQPLSDAAISPSLRYQAQVDFELKRTVLQALHMTDAQIEQLEQCSECLGSYTLLAPQDGIVQKNLQQLTYLVGQNIPANTPLMQLTDESSLWVIADIPAEQYQQLHLDKPVQIQSAEQFTTGQILGRSHKVTHSTRTEQLIIRLDNKVTHWHSGQFVDIKLQLPLANEQEYVLLPDSALVRNEQGNWQVFIAIANTNNFQRRDIQLVASQAGLNWVQGLQVGEFIVTSGAFFLAAEQAKANFDPHNH